MRDKRAELRNLKADVSDIKQRIARLMGGSGSGVSRTRSHSHGSRGSYTRSRSISPAISRIAGKVLVGGEVHDVSRKSLAALPVRRGRSRSSLMSSASGLSMASQGSVLSSRTVRLSRKFSSESCEQAHKMDEFLDDVIYEAMTQTSSVMRGTPKAEATQLIRDAVVVSEYAKRVSKQDANIQDINYTVNCVLERAVELLRDNIHAKALSKSVTSVSALRDVILCSEARNKPGFGSRGMRSGRRIRDFFQQLRSQQSCTFDIDISDQCINDALRKGIERAVGEDHSLAQDPEAVHYVRDAVVRVEHFRNGGDTSSFHGVIDIDTMSRCVEHILVRAVEVICENKFHVLHNRVTCSYDLRHMIVSNEARRGALIRVDDADVNFTQFFDDLRLQGEREGHAIVPGSFHEKERVIDDVVTHVLSSTAPYATSLKGQGLGSARDVRSSIVQLAEKGDYTSSQPLMQHASSVDGVMGKAVDVIQELQHSMKEFVPTRESLKRLVVETERDKNHAIDDVITLALKKSTEEAPEVDAIEDVASVSGIRKAVVDAEQVRRGFATSSIDFEAVQTYVDNILATACDIVRADPRYSGWRLPNADTLRDVIVRSEETRGNLQPVEVHHTTIVQMEEVGTDDVGNPLETSQSVTVVKTQSSTVLPVGSRPTSPTSVTVSVTSRVRAGATEVKLDRILYRSVERMKGCQQLQVDIEISLGLTNNDIILQYVRDAVVLTSSREDNISKSSIRANVEAVKVCVDVILKLALTEARRESIIDASFRSLESVQSLRDVVMSTEAMRMLDTSPQEVRDSFVTPMQVFLDTHVCSTGYLDDVTGEMVWLEPFGGVTSTEVRLTSGQPDADVRTMQTQTISHTDLMAIERMPQCSRLRNGSEFFDSDGMTTVDIGPGGGSGVFNIRSRDSNSRMSLQRILRNALREHDVMRQSTLRRYGPSRSGSESVVYYDNHGFNVGDETELRQEIRTGSGGYSRVISATPSSNRLRHVVRDTIQNDLRNRVYIAPVNSMASSSQRARRLLSRGTCDMVRPRLQNVVRGLIRLAAEQARSDQNESICTRQLDLFQRKLDQLYRVVCASTDDVSDDDLLTCESPIRVSSHVNVLDRRASEGLMSCHSDTVLVTGRRSTMDDLYSVASATSAVPPRQLKSIQRIQTEMNLGPVASKLSSLVIEFSIGCQDVENLRMSDVNLGRRDRRRRLVRSISSAMSIPPPTSRMRDARDFGISYAAPLPTRSTMQVNVNNENIDEEQLLTSINPVDVMNSVSPQVVSRLSDKTMLQISKASLQSILSADTRQRFQEIIAQRHEAEVRSFVDDVINSLYLVVRARMRTNVEVARQQRYLKRLRTNRKQQQKQQRRRRMYELARDRRSTDDSGSDQQLLDSAAADAETSDSDVTDDVDVSELMAGAEQDLFSNVLPGISDCIVQMLCQQARTLDSFDLDLLMMLYGSQYVDTIISNAILRTHVDVARRVNSLLTTPSGRIEEEARNADANTPNIDGEFQGWSSVFKVKTDAGNWMSDVPEATAQTTAAQAEAHAAPGTSNNNSNNANHNLNHNQSSSSAALCSSDDWVTSSLPRNVNSNAPANSSSSDESNMEMMRTTAQQVSDLTSRVIEALHRKLNAQPTEALTYDCHYFNVFLPFVLYLL